MTSTPALVRPAATLLLLRDAPQFEVLMVRRHRQIDFAGGALVFPGGKVEPSDAELSPSLLVGAQSLDADDRHARIAAVRETFEESGVLLAVDADGAVCRPSDELDAARASLAVCQGFAEMLEALGVRLDLTTLTPFARWIAPAVVPKRYDRRFYLADAPEDQLAACDGAETVDAEWIAPSEALRLGETCERTIIFPTRLNLRLLAESGSAAEAIAAARLRPSVTVEPRIVLRDGERRLSLPADAGYGAVEEPFDFR
ncbi:NUDIX hydrolase [soil metagenome]